AAVEVVGRHDAHAGELLDMAMTVDAARDDVASARIDVALTRREMLREGDDLLPGDADVATHRLRGGRHGAVSDGEVERVHKGSLGPGVNPGLNKWGQINITANAQLSVMLI